MSRDNSCVLSTLRGDYDQNPPSICFPDLVPSLLSIAQRASNVEGIIF